MRTLESAVAAIAEENALRDSWGTPLDYFSWGRDKRHKIENTESLPATPSTILRSAINSAPIQKISALLGGSARAHSPSAILRQFKAHYSAFNDTYQLMSDDESRNLFAELILMKLVSEKGMRLSLFTQTFIDSYEEASEILLRSNESLPIYGWLLKKVTLETPAVTLFTVPTILNLHLTGRLYRYANKDCLIGVEGGDIVIDAGVGWGDTTIYLAALAGEQPGGHLYAFDILEEGLGALSQQMDANPEITNVTPVLRALADKDGAVVSITPPGPGAKVTGKKTGRTVETMTIDTFVAQRGLETVNLIKMDIEGAEVPALKGASETIRRFKPKLAISAYHKWDDLLVIPALLHSIRQDYSYYLDCTTGFGGETILYCR